MKVLVAGASGMAGRAASAYFAGAGDEIFSHDHKSLDIADAVAVRETLDRERPDIVVNCAAWTDVDGCELDRERAYRVNALGPENLAAASRRIGASLITISTDYVFDGEKQGFYTQRDDPQPVSVYGAAKLDGERRAQSASARTTIVRTGWLFGTGGRNFLSTINERARRGERLSAISDAYGTPTHVRDLVARLRELALRDLPGIYHVVNSGEGASYEEFARAALDLAGYESANLEGIAMETLKRAAPRPRNSRLRCLMSEAVGLEPLPFWRDALKDFVARSGCVESES